jgi:protein-S-isoprenylcysteine O-methyltransferase Ste14
MILEWGERIAVLSLYGWLVAKIVAPFFTGHGNAGNLILLLSEGIVLLMILFRRSTKHISLRPADWLLAFSATIAPMFVYPDSTHHLIPPIFGTVTMLMGLTVQIYAKMVLGRSCGCVAANRGLKFFGPYRYVRHPIYAGYLLSDLGFLLMNPTVWNLLVCIICYSLQIPRLLAEERLLRQDESYSKYMEQVRFRLIPKVF